MRMNVSKPIPKCILLVLTFVNFLGILKIHMWQSEYANHIRRRSSDSAIYLGGSQTPDMNKVLVIGGAGYVGSYLSSMLQSKGLEVKIFDKAPNLAEDFNPAIPIVKMHSRDVTQSHLSGFGTVIFLGGCTGRKSCDVLSTEEVEEENVSNAIDIMKKMSSFQHFIAASTSAITEGSFGATEDVKVRYDLLDSYSASMFRREVRLREFLDHDEKQEHPKISLLRFGTVVGNSPGQRTDLMIPSFFRSAYTVGRLEIGGHNTMRSFLTFHDLGNAIHTLISKTNPTDDTSSRFNIWHLASFDATVLKIASTIASLTGASIDSNPSDNTLSPLISSQSGFSLDCTSFEKQFSFNFEGSLLTAIHDFDQNIPHSIIPKGPHQVQEDEDIIQCPVCGSTGQQVVLDLGSQPLANDFSPDRDIALAKPRFPLKLVRCRVCNHYHLSHVVDRSDLFEHYLYQSGTSVTLSDYFEWLSQKVVKESNRGDAPGSILEIACNDGSQLDRYLKHNWKTFGVDPAANLAAIAAEKHTVRTGFWPLQFPELPKGNDLTAITAQNVVAHVPDVVAFLKGCADVMGPETKLYIQTSQCNMQQLGQFDTVYHEHISFFTGHSFQKAADLAGLEVISFETTPIHGESCLVTMQLGEDAGDADTVSPTLEDRLEKEMNDGITSDFFALKFSSHANSIREWIQNELFQFKSLGHIVGGYGAAAKGMVLLHYIIGDNNDGSSYLDFVLDDAELKQNTYCPGTAIPVQPMKSLQELSDPEKPLVVLIFAWNFFDEITQKIVGVLKESSHKGVTFLVPFPEPRVMYVDLTAVETRLQLLRKLPHYPTPIPNPITNDDTRTKTLMITHQRNEELLMPFFIMHHASMFDKAILIDYESDDHTLDIIERFAPPSWEVVKSTTGSTFDSAETDEQVMFYEKLHPEHWHLGLTTTEFLIAPNLRQDLSSLTRDETEKAKSFISEIPMFQADGNNTEPLVYSRALPKQRYTGWLPGGHRYIHYNTEKTHNYLPGRHVYVRPENSTATDIDWSGIGVIMKFVFSPWPEVIERKLNVGATIPQSDIDKEWGSHHTKRVTGGEAYLEYEYCITQKVIVSSLCNAKQIDDFHINMSRLFREVFPKMECHPDDVSVDGSDEECGEGFDGEVGGDGVVNGGGVVAGSSVGDVEDSENSNDGEFVEHMVDTGDSDSGVER